MKKCICISVAACCMHMLYADVYFNSKKFSQSEKIDDIVYIGHENATDGGDPSNALVTVKSGAAWTNTEQVTLGKTAGTAQLTVESGASVNFNTLLMADKYDTRCRGILELQNNAVVSVSGITAPGRTNSKCYIHISNGAVISNVCGFVLGKSFNGNASLELEGGSLFFDSTENAHEISMTVGSMASKSGGVISGYGFVGFHDANSIMNKYGELGREYWGGFVLCGQVIADGKGSERDLDFSKMGLPHNTDSRNTCGTNGYYAVNKGRLLLPRSLPRKGNHICVGGFPSASDAQEVNTFTYKFDNATHKTTGKYVISELYATDREDIPMGLPSGSRFFKSSVWRIGYFGAIGTARNRELAPRHKVDFETVNLRFHYDPRLARIEDVDIIKVYRYANAESGWICVGTAIPSSKSPYIQTEDFGPSPDLYNFGWFAIVGEKKVGTVVVVR